MLYGRTFIAHTVDLGQDVYILYKQNNLGYWEEVYRCENQRALKGIVDLAKARAISLEDAILEIVMQPVGII